MARNLHELRRFSWEVRPALLLLSVGVLALAFVIGVWIWQLILRRFSIVIRYRTLARIWFLTNVARYIPGKIWQFVGVAQMGGAAGLPRLTAVTSLALQMGFTLAAALIVGVLLLPASGDIAGRIVASLRWLTPIALLAVHPRAIGLGLVLLRRITRREVADWRGSWGEGVWLLTLAGLAWLVYGTAFYLFLQALIPLPAAALPPVVAMNALAFAAGYVVLIAPAGLGAKEASLAGFLSMLVPLPVAAALAVAARLWTMAGELLPVPFFLFAAPRLPPRE